MEAIAAILNYRRPDLVQNVIDDLAGTPLIVVIENGCEPSEYRRPHHRTEVAVFPLEENGLFSGGWNVAMQLFAQVLPGIKRVWMLNSDVRGVSAEMLDALDAEVAELGALAISPAFNSPHRHMWPQGSGVRRVNWIDWTAPMVDIRQFIMAGCFDEAFAGYGADLDLAYRAKMHGYQMFVDDALCFEHLGSQTAMSEGMAGVMCNTSSMNLELLRKYNVSDWTLFLNLLEE